MATGPARGERVYCREWRFVGRHRGGETKTTLALLAFLRNSTKARAFIMSSFHLFYNGTPSHNESLLREILTC